MIEYKDGRAISWEQLPWEQMNSHVRRAGFGTSSLLLVLNEVSPRNIPRPNTHPDHVQVTFVLSGSGVYHVGEEHNTFGPGSMMIIPAGAEHYMENHGSAPVRNVDAFAPVPKELRQYRDWMLRR